MKVTNDSFENNSIILGGKSLGTATIKNSPEFFQMLSDALYSDKIMAVCREIMCNAWDAHIVSNKTNVPIFIDINDTSVSFRDFGEGIPKERMQEVYFQYGNSSKTQDVNQTGGFGLGSKAPFAYSDTFTVISRNNGIESKYKLIKSGRYEDGNPEMIEIYSKPTLESGLEVILDIKPTDFRYFLNRIEHVGFFGDILWVKNNCFEETNPKINLSKETSYLIDRIYTNNTNSIFYSHFDSKLIVIVGNVAYPVDMKVLPKNVISRFNSINISDNIDHFIFKIFDKNITITPSRESIAYTPKTVKILCKEINKNIDKFLSDYRIFKKNFIEEKILPNFTGIARDTFFKIGLTSEKVVSLEDKENIDKYTIFLSYYLYNLKNIEKKLVKNNIKFFKNVYKCTNINKFYKIGINNKVNKKYYTQELSYKNNKGIYLKTVFLIKNNDSIRNISVQEDDFKYINITSELYYKCLVIKNTDLFNNTAEFNKIKNNLAKKGINFIKKEINISKSNTVPVKSKTAKEYFVYNMITDQKSNYTVLNENDYLINFYEKYIYSNNNLLEFYKNKNINIYYSRDYDSIIKKKSKKFSFKDSNDFSEKVLLNFFEENNYFKLAVLLYLIQKDSIIFMDMSKFFSKENIWKSYIKDTLPFNKNFIYDYKYVYTFAKSHSTILSKNKLYKDLKVHLKKNITLEKNIKNIVKTIDILNILYSLEKITYEDFHKINTILLKYY